MSSMDLQEQFNTRLKDFLETHTRIDALVVAYSGGLDSQALLHLCKHFIDTGASKSSTRPALKLKAIHVNHGIHPEAKNWQVFCEKNCQRIDSDFISETIHISQSNNLEAQARRLRYACFEKHCGEKEVLLTAHHQDDQLETILFRLFRGGGIDALSGMPATRNLSRALLFRPLLNESKSQLLVYAQEKQLEWIEDDSNQDTNFSRNFIRSELIPLIRTRWPQVASNVERSAALLAEQADMLQQLAQDDLSALKSQQTDLEQWGDCISLTAFKQLTLARQKNVLRFWMKSFAVNMPSEKRLQALINFATDSRESAGEMFWQDYDAHTQLSWRVFEAHLFLFREAVSGNISDNEVSDNSPEHEPTEEIWHVATQSELNDHGRIYRAYITNDVGIDPDIKTLTIARRQGGERCQPLERAHSQSLKKLFQEYRVPSWERDTLPLFYSEEKLVAVANLWICAEFASDKTGAWQIQRL